MALSLLEPFPVRFLVCLTAPAYRRGISSLDGAMVYREAADGSGPAMVDITEGQTSLTIAVKNGAISLL